MNLILVRHANDQPASDSRKYDDPLSPEGRDQAKYVAGRFMTMYPAPEPTKTFVYSSPLLRAAMTAVELIRATGASGYMWTELAEYGYLWGDPGRSRQELAERFPELQIPPEVTENGWAGHVSSETESELVQRGALVLKKVLERHPREVDHVVFLVTHDFFIHGFLSALFQTSNAIEFHHGYGGITQLFFNADGKIIVQWINSTTHMWTKPLVTDADEPA